MIHAQQSHITPYLLLQHIGLDLTKSPSLTGLNWFTVVCFSHTGPGLTKCHILIELKSLFQSFNIVDTHILKQFMSNIVHVLQFYKVVGRVNHNYTLHVTKNGYDVGKEHVKLYHLQCNL